MRPSKYTKIATYNVNGINSRLPNLLAWLEREQPDIVCLQELKAPDEAFPSLAIAGVGYESLAKGQRSWNGVAILVRGREIVPVRDQLPGDTADDHSRYLEAAVGGLIVCCLYLPNGNPQPGPKFEYKLRWFERLIAHAATLIKSPHPVILAGDFNVVPTDFDIYNPRSWRKDALLQPESRACWQRLLEQGWVDALRTLHVDQQIFTFWDYFREHWPRNAGLRIDHLLLNKTLAKSLRTAGVDTWVRGEPHASDHAPAWVTVELTDKSKARKQVMSRRRRTDALQKTPGTKRGAV
jgi:exodeoxyribonuclease-3